MARLQFGFSRSNSTKKFYSKSNKSFEQNPETDNRRLTVLLKNLIRATWLTVYTTKPLIDSCTFALMSKCIFTLSTYIYNIYIHYSILLLIPKSTNKRRDGNIRARFFIKQVRLFKNISVELFTKNVYTYI